MGKKQAKKGSGLKPKASASSMMIDELPTVSHGVLPAWMVKSRPEAGD